jgi:hypothetical protein
MQKAYRNLIKFALSRNCTISVWDGEEWQVERSTNEYDIAQAVRSVEEATLHIRNAAGEIVGNALVAAFGLEPDETVIDYEITGFMNEWETHYASTMPERKLWV